MAEMPKVAFITGIGGMDGSHLAELLLSKGYIVHGLLRRSSLPNTSRIDHIKDRLILHYGDLTDPFSIIWALKKSHPDEIYNLASQNHVHYSWDTPYYTIQATGVGLLNVLEAVRILDIPAKIYQASTSELYSGKIGEAPQNEETKFDPVSPYGSAKLYAFQIAKNYREAYKIFVCNGILFNHESNRRGDDFVTQKIIKSVTKGEVKLGNLDSSRDWGFAPEYMEQAWLMLQQDKPDDYVVATGETHTVREFVQWVEQCTGTKLNVIISPEFVRPAEVHLLKGDSTKAKEKLGWEPKTKGIDIVRKMI